MDFGLTLGMEISSFTNQHTKRGSRRFRKIFRRDSDLGIGQDLATNIKHPNSFLRLLGNQMRRFVF